MDKYTNFGQLQALETEGNDYAILIRLREGSRTAVIAPHGGGIEPRTAELAEAIAGSEFNLYCFRGLKQSGNSVLHITSHRFDEPRCLALLANQDIVVALHGCSKVGERVLLGGRDQRLVVDLAKALEAVGIIAEVSGHEFPGQEATNVCNRSATGMGAQIEMSMSFRVGPNAEKLVKVVRDVLETQAGVDTPSTS